MHQRLAEYTLNATGIEIIIFKFNIISVFISCLHALFFLCGPPEENKVMCHQFQSVVYRAASEV